MGVQGKNGSDIYKGVKFTYSVYGENSVFGGTATVTVHYGSYTEDTQLVLNHSLDTIEMAEKAIIASAKAKIDNL
jgi:hypothetical protein